MRKRLYAYKPGSASAKALAQAMGVKRIKHEGSRFRPRPSDVVINWGATDLPPLLENARILNHPAGVRRACNKLSFFDHMLNKGVEVVVPHTTSKQHAEEWIEEGHTVVCRTVLNGNSGDGIVIASTLDELVPAPLYTQYKKKKSEWRVHIAMNDVIFIQQKVRCREVADEDVNWQVRNHKNGFVFAHKDLDTPAAVVSAAGDVMEAIDLDFGAVDVIYNAHEEKAYVLEVNCAPGLEGTTLERYAETFR